LGGKKKKERKETTCHRRRRSLPLHPAGKEKRSLDHKISVPPGGERQGPTEGGGRLTTRGKLSDGIKRKEGSSKFVLQKNDRDQKQKTSPDDGRHHSGSETKPSKKQKEGEVITKPPKKEENSTPFFQNPPDD